MLNYAESLHPRTSRTVEPSRLVSRGHANKQPRLDPDTNFRIPASNKEKESLCAAQTPIMNLLM